ncbi:ribonuclease pancreatic-like isoform X1 [Antechinus flavipes]|uniref:ribonuclease pancreatic-like isoform X1 n=1 Tax=Antechinus flavipes TaxID=38775 RepID=UPI0022364215|nr:ribonuclease pancreatic-like isoform X1 [Antechinus flavipes]XP_051836340.1 ribonuclease pancreatic-like isoform X1 [Antechinus flavipes]XP_051836341.1 ribonuclease pancreatic-like isoform X1 [Antechinus flavipes]
MASPGNERPSLCFREENLLPMRDSSSLFAGSSRREQKFWQEHHNKGSSNQEVQKQMRQINSGKTRCKPINTIIHSPKDTIKDICTDPSSKNVPCKNGRDNCFVGAKPHPVTICEEKANSQPGKCRYNCTKKEAVKVTVACENGRPVHLERTHDEL